jgi:hypothetical protein
MRGMLSLGLVAVAAIIVGFAAAASGKIGEAVILFLAFSFSASSSLWAARRRGFALKLLSGGFSALFVGSVMVGLGSSADQIAAFTALAGFGAFAAALALSRTTQQL